MKIKTNIIDISNKTGFSVTTVSRVLNGKAKIYRISSATKEKIEVAAKELNYSPNQFAQSLRTGCSKTIALIIPSINNPFFAEIAYYINAEVRKYDFTLIISDSNDDINIEKLEIQHLLNKNIDGLIIVPCSDQSEHLVNLYDKGFPLICIDRYFDHVDLPYVSSDNYEGAYRATQFLICQGHKFISCIEGQKSSISNKLRAKGFIDAVKNAGLNEYSICGNAFTEENGYNETKHLLERNSKPTAIFSFGNTIAMGCLRALREERINVPEDISLITFDHALYLNYIQPPMTHVAQPISDICKTAVVTIIKTILQKKQKLTQVLLKTNLVVKESVTDLNVHR